MKKLLIIPVIIIFDQFTKFLATNGLLPQWGGFLDNLACNQYLSWGIPITGSILLVVWLIIISFFVFLLKKLNWNWLLLITLGGSISNIIDRIRIGCVIDFIQFGDFPIFNLADVCITAGIVLFLITKLWRN